MRHATGSDAKAHRPTSQRKQEASKESKERAKQGKGSAPVCLLDLAHEREVAVEHAGDERLRVFSCEDARHAEAVQQRREGRLVPGAIIDARCVACTYKV